MNFTFLGIGAVIAAILGGFIFFHWSETRSDKQLAALKDQAHAAGILEGQRQVNDAQNAALLQQVKQIAAATAQTNQEMARIRVEAATSKAKIDSFEVQTTAIDHPEVVEQWANKTTNDLFAGIQQASQTEATDPK